MDAAAQAGDELVSGRDLPVEAGADELMSGRDLPVEDAARSGPPTAAADPVPVARSDGRGAGPPGAPGRHVEVAVDAAGVAAARTWTYSVPPGLDDVAPGEAVLVEWGRRRVIGVVLGEAPPPENVAAKPLAGRVRADGPLLPPLSITLARAMAARYLAPPAMAVRAMLPPGLLEKVQLVATALGAEPPEPPQGAPTDDPATRSILEALGSGSRPVRDLPDPEGRPALLRRLRALASAGRVDLEWTLGAAGALPRYARRASLTPAGREVAAGGAAADGRAVGPRQRALLADLAARPDDDPADDVPRLEERHGAGTVRALARRGLVTVETLETMRDPLAARPPGLRGSRPAGSTLTDIQAVAVASITAAITSRDATPLLLDGPTGAGKTTIYVEALSAALAAGRPGLVLVPEVALVAPLVDRLRHDLAAEVVILHSAMGEGERADGWRRIRAGLADIVVGTRLAVLAPLADVGVVIVDEEHDAAYKSDRTPRMQARDLAVVLGGLAGAAVVLGSATPSIEAIGRSELGQWRRISLTERPIGRPPAVEVVDLRAELAAGNRDLVSARLAQLLAALDPGASERAILVINRRGAASAVLCRDCGHVLTCGECTLPLVYHQAGMTLRCHHCGAAAPMPPRCPACRSPRIRYLGGGTERLEQEVRAHFPALRVGRLDRDVVEHRGAADRVVDAFASGRIDVLVGTSLVTKGLDIPEVTLVGIVSADIALTLPDERAAERTYQLLVQAVGRAGRGDRLGRAIIQTYQPDHPAIRAVADGSAAAFYASELAQRRLFGAPPFGRTAKLTVGLEDRDAARSAAREMADRLRTRASEAGFAVTVAGPAPAYVPRRAGRWRFNIVLRGDDPVGLLGGDPGVPWSVDVDPESLL